MSLVALYITS